MKRRSALIIILTAVSYGIHAQNADDLLRFSENHYEGTARTVAMGNAFTALGGDLGSISINPAGSAVAKYSQMAITPSLTFSASTTSGTPLPNGRTPYFNREFTSSMTRFTIPNFGMTFNWETGRKNGLKSMTFGFVINATNSWNEDVFASGRNTNYTSYMGAMAARAVAKGYTGSMILADDAYDNPALDWDIITGFDSYMIDNIVENGEIIDNEFAGASEIIYGKDIEVPGPLDQTLGRSVKGSKYEYLFNFGANISDFLYLGVNLGFNTISYGYRQYFKESSVYIEDFPTMTFEDEQGNAVQGYFDSMNAGYTYSADGTGVFAKLGMILTPFKGLRIGAAFQTPTAMTIEEQWQNTGSTSFRMGESSGRETFNAESPYGNNRFDFVSPLRANFGVAYTFGSLGLVSADYELCDYGNMRYNGSDYADDMDYAQELNQEISMAMGISHMVRAGVEVKPIPALSVRAGYGMTTSARRLGHALHNASFGLGYSSKGSFYADIACRRTFLPAEYIMPYQNYIGDYDSEGNFIPDEAHLSPEIRNLMSDWKVLMTFGWRF